MNRVTDICKINYSKTTFSKDFLTYQPEMDWSLGLIILFTYHIA
jgi:hypothetical protein